LDVPGRDWLRDPAAVIERIERVLAEGEEAVLPEQNAAPGEPPAEPAAIPSVAVTIDELSEQTAASAAPAAESRALPMCRELQQVLEHQPHGCRADDQLRPNRDARSATDQVA
jgi:hypothetical protein